MNKYKLDYNELKYLHVMILFQNLIDHKNRRLRDSIHNKIIGQMEEAERQEIYHKEDIEDAKLRRKIVK